MSAAEQDVAAPEPGRQPTRPGRCPEPVRDAPAVAFVDGLGGHPALGGSAPASTVRFARPPEAPRHARDEEATVVGQGKLALDLGGSGQRLRRSRLAVSPANVFRAARAHGRRSLEYQVYCPPRQAPLDRAATPGPKEERWTWD